MGTIYIIFYFILYSFSGWIIEVIYRSHEQKQFVNPGFLSGPFLPIYGSSMLILLFISMFVEPYSFIIQIISIFLITTTVEYLTGYLLEKGFGMKLWDYSDERFNLHGRISLKFSAVWTMMAYFFISFVHPLVEKITHKFDNTILIYGSLTLIIIISIDLIYSWSKMLYFRDKISYLIDNYFDLNAFEIEEILISVKKFLRSFPYLAESLQKNLTINFKTRLTDKIQEYKKEFDDMISKKKPYSAEYDSIVEDILHHQEFQKKYIESKTALSLQHVKKVSFLSYKLAKYLDLDYKSAARGALLHDFLLSDETLSKQIYKKISRNSHAYQTAVLTHAEKFFQLNYIEKEIIVKHMRPLALPRCRETFIVYFADKYISSKGFFEYFKTPSFPNSLFGR